MTDLREVNKTDDFQGDTARKALTLDKYRPKADFDTALVFKYSRW